MTLPDEIYAEAVASYQEHRSQRKAVAAVSISRDVLRYRLEIAAQRGLLLDHAPAMPGYAIHCVVERVDGKWIKQTGDAGDEFAAPVGHVVKRVSALVASSSSFSTRPIHPIQRST